jgi:hypothetical protein
VAITHRVKWVPCHHGMARPQVADRGDGLQIWRVAANILNKQWRTADRGWFSSLGVWWTANNPQHKNLIVANYLQAPRKWQDCLARHEHRKTDMRLGTRNVRNLYRAGSLNTVAREV